MTTVAEAEQTILRTAVARANQIAQSHDHIGDTFQIAPGDLADIPIEILPHVVAQLDEDKIDEIQEYAAQGLTEALEEHANLVVGSVLGFAWEGYNYGDQFSEVAED